MVKILDNPDLHALLITSKLLIYLTTCINPIIYVLMSSEYRQVVEWLEKCLAQLIIRLTAVSSHVSLQEGSQGDLKTLTFLKV